MKLNFEFKTGTAFAFSWYESYSLLSLFSNSIGWKVKVLAEHWVTLKFKALIHQTLFQKDFNWNLILASNAFWQSAIHRSLKVGFAAF